MQDIQTNKPLRMNVDKARKSLSSEEAFYLLNHERSLQMNGSEKSSIDKTTGLGSNYAACDMEQPAGENYSVGSYKSPITNEEYQWVYNSNGVHYIMRTSDSGCEIVYHGCLPLSPEPEHSIEQFRAYLKVTKTCKNRGGKDLVWVDGSDNPIGQLDVEASIATDFFTTPFFQNPCYNPCDFVRNIVPRPCACITAEYIPLPAEEIGLENSLLDRGFKFIYRHRYYDGRVSEWSDPSTLYYQDSKGCFEGGIGFSRCMKLRMPIGNPLVEKVEIGFSDDNGMTWYLYDTIEKYNPYTTPSQQWYERTLAPEITSTLTEDCYFTTTFCNNKQRVALDRAEVTRVYNPVPRSAQGIIPIKDSLGFYNYKKGNCPISQSEAKKVKIELDCDSDNSCEIKYANVTVRAIVHNTGYHLNQMIYRMKEGSSDDKSDQAWFGGLRVRSREYQGGYADGEGWMAGYDQFFRGDFRNFVTYIEGTEYWGEMKQWRADRNFQGRREAGVIAGFENKETRNMLRRQQEHGTFYYQEYTFRVPRGTSGFIRMQSHRAQEYEPNTSTYVIGTVNIRQYKGDLDISNYIQRNKEEIFFDTCNGDVIFDEAFVIQDNAVDLALKKRASAYFGYITDENGLPVEGLRVTDENDINAVRSVTDHNGFFHFYIREGKDGGITFTIAGEKDATATFKKIKDIFIQSESGANTEANTQIYDSDLPDYKSNYYATATVRVKDCDGAGIGGVRVAISGSKYGTTDAQGFAKIRVRNYDYPRSFRVAIADPKGCFSLDCEGRCNPCMPNSFAYGISSYNGRPVITIPDLIVNRNPALNMVTGLKAGGRYGFGFVVEEDDKQSAVVNRAYLDVPSTQVKNRLSFCNISFDFGDAKFSKTAKCIKFVRTKNLNPYRLQWVVDKIERTSNNRVKLTIQSLNDYNEFYNFKTNTVYSHLQGDRVEFIRNGDAKIFDVATYGAMNFLTLSPLHDKNVSGKEEAGADYFNQVLINDDPRLIDVKEGAVIELKPQNIEQEDQIYYTICASIPLEDGVPVVKKGTFHTFDTFIVNRKIGKFPSLPFEHHSPSDFWVNPIPDSPIGYSDAGRPHRVNPYEDERRFGRNITLTNATELNVFGYIEKTFDAPEQGDIIAMSIADNARVIGVCENDWFTASTADDLLKMSGDGNIRVLRGEEAIGDPEPKAGKYGCKYQHVGSILFGDGFASWMDIETANYIVSNWSAARPITSAVAQSYFVHMGQHMESTNRRLNLHPFDKYRCTTGYSRLTGRIFLTMKAFRHAGIDNGHHLYDNPNNTITFDPFTGDCLGFVSFTPDRYGHVKIYDGKGSAFLTYLHGIPYVHPEIADSINEFYGVPCDRVIGFTINKHSNKIKIGVAMEIQDEMMWFAELVTTDRDGYRSEIVPARFEGVGNKWSAAFMGNSNSQEGLFGSDTPKGYEISITLVRDNTIENRYKTINPDKQRRYDELDFITTKFDIVEQSGFTANR